MKTERDEILSYVLKRQNIAATLEILKRGQAIRQAALAQFWQALHDHLKTTMPKRYERMKHLKWDWWSQHNLPDDVYRLLYFEDTRHEDQAQMLSFGVGHYMTPSAYELSYGLRWAQPEPAKSKVQQLVPVVKLRQSLQAGHFSSFGYWFGRSKVAREDSVEDFLKRHVTDPGLIRKIGQNFWQLVEDTFAQVTEANRAIQKLRSK